MSWIEPQKIKYFYTAIIINVQFVLSFMSIHSNNTILLFYSHMPLYLTNVYLLLLIIFEYGMTPKNGTEYKTSYKKYEKFVWNSKFMSITGGINKRQCILSFPSKLLRNCYRYIRHILIMILNESADIMTEWHFANISLLNVSYISILKSRRWIWKSKSLSSHVNIQIICCCNVYKFLIAKCCPTV